MIFCEAWKTTVYYILLINRFNFRQVNLFFFHVVLCNCIHERCTKVTAFEWFTRIRRRRRKKNALMLEKPFGVLALFHLFIFPRNGNRFMNKQNIMNVIFLKKVFIDYFASIFS